MTPRRPPCRADVQGMLQFKRTYPDRHMQLLPIDSPALMNLATSWLGEKDNYQWLDFGDGRQIVTPQLLKIMLQRNTHFLRMYTNFDGVPIGIVALNSIDRRSGTGTFWGLTGDKSFRNRGYGSIAAGRFLTLAFGELDLHSMNTWAVEHNPSRKIIERLGFRLVGQQRQCHRMNGELYDRVFYDLLASEHWQRARMLAGTGEDAGLPPRRNRALGRRDANPAAEDRRALRATGVNNGQSTTTGTLRPDAPAGLGEEARR